MASPNLISAFQRLSRNASWVVMVDVPDVDLLESACGCGVHVLAVLSDEGDLETIEMNWDGDWPENLQMTSLLLGPETAEVPWFHFNDHRHNGRLPLEVLQSSFPNLRLEKVELRRQITLAEFLERWEPAESDAGLLILGDASPLPLIASGSACLQRLKSVAVLGGQQQAHAVEETGWEHEIDALLQANWLVRSVVPADDNPAGIVWERDEKLRQISTLQMERDGLMSERDVLRAAQGELMLQRDSLEVEKETLRGQLNGQLTEAITERDALKAEREALMSERDGLMSERDVLRAAQGELMLQRDSLEVEKQSMLVQIDAFRTSQSEGSAELTLLSGRCSALVREVDELKQQLDAERLDCQSTKIALELLFPLELYKVKTPELAEADREVLLSHFLVHGRNENRLATYTDLADECSRLKTDNAMLIDKLKLLDQQFNKASMQIEFLKDIVARIAIKP